MNHSIIDKRGQDTPAILQANADGSIKPSKPDERTLILSPFPDGSCLKMVKREWPGNAPAPEKFDQHVLVNVAGDQIAITRNESFAHLICDAVNMLFAAHLQAQRETAGLVNVIAPTKDLASTQH